MFALSNALNPDVVKTGLDKVFFQNFNTPEMPGYATVASAGLFRQETIDRAAVIQQSFASTGLWGQKSEEQDVPSNVPRMGNTKTDSVIEFSDGIDITRWFYNDNMFGVVDKALSEFGEMGRLTRDQGGFGIFRGAFTTTLTADGVPLVSDNHVTLSGNTVDNKLTAALSEASLNTAILMLYQQIGQAGVMRGSTPAVLLVPPALFKLALEITKSEYRSNTANNDLNYYSTIFPGLQVMTSRWIGTGATGGSDTAWFLLASNHTITRYVREDVWTVLVDWKTQRNNNYIYKGGFREVVAVQDYIGVVGSDGTT